MEIHGGKTILGKLFYLQQNFKAPKDKWNAFGKYHFRSAESMIESVKPLLKETETIILFNCESKENCGHTRMEVDVFLVHPESGEYVSTHGSCREDEQRAGMCASQNSGSTESFAKKYALGDLLLVDDCKDDDDNEQHPGNPKNAKRTETRENKAVATPKTAAPTATPPEQKAPQSGSNDPSALKAAMKEAWTLYNTLDSVKSMDDNSRSKFFFATLKTAVGKEDPHKLTLGEWGTVVSRIKAQKEGK